MLKQAMENAVVVSLLLGFLINSVLADECFPRKSPLMKTQKDLSVPFSEVKYFINNNTLYLQGDFSEKPIKDIKLPYCNKPSTKQFIDVNGPKSYLKISGCEIPQIKISKQENLINFQGTLEEVQSSKLENREVDVKSFSEADSILKILQRENIKFSDKSGMNDASFKKNLILNNIKNVRSSSAKFHSLEIQFYEVTFPVQFRFYSRNYGEMSNQQFNEYFNVKDSIEFLFMKYNSELYYLGQSYHDDCSFDVYGFETHSAEPNKSLFYPTDLLPFVVNTYSSIKNIYRFSSNQYHPTFYIDFSKVSSGFINTKINN